jgi:hypothetical protein
MGWGGIVKGERGEKGGEWAGERVWSAAEWRQYGVAIHLWRAQSVPKLQEDKNKI